jgi:plasmid stabilization system protein ParE
MKHLKVPPAAREEIRAAMRWYESRRPALGVEFIAIIDEALRHLAEDPETAPVWRADRPYRRWLVRRFPYAVFFELGETVSVVGGNLPLQERPSKRFTSARSFVRDCARRVRMSGIARLPCAPCSRSR